MIAVEMNEGGEEDDKIWIDGVDLDTWVLWGLCHVVQEWIRYRYFIYDVGIPTGVHLVEWH